MILNKNKIHFLYKKLFVVIGVFMIGMGSVTAQCPSGIFCLADNESNQMVIYLNYTGSNPRPEELSVYKVSFLISNGTSEVYIPPALPISGGKYSLDGNEAICDGNQEFKNITMTIHYPEAEGGDFKCEFVDGEFVDPRPITCPDRIGNSACPTPNMGIAFYYDDMTDIRSVSFQDAIFNFEDIPEENGVYSPTEFFQDIPEYCDTPRPTNYNVTVYFGHGTSDEKVCVYIQGDIPTKGVLCETCPPEGNNEDCLTGLLECRDEAMAIIKEENNCKQWDGACSFQDRTFRDGKVLIGSSNFPADFHLGVRKGIMTEQFKVQTYGEWADYVFNEEYDLLSLNEVEQHINKRGHLPNTPSALEIESQGYFDIGEVQVNHQEKIEEIFLHLISLKKEATNLKERLKVLKEENQALVK